MFGCCPILVIFGLITAPSPVGGCSVHPTSAVVVVRERVNLTCSTFVGGSVVFWHIATNNLNKTAIYTPTVYKRDGTIRTPEKVAEGYFVTHPADNETALLMNETTLSQAGSYTCVCNSYEEVSTTVVVLVSEPKFATNRIGAVGEPVALSCSLSFSASSNVSCGLRIEDASGSTVARRKECSLNDGLFVCNLNYTVTADTSADQSYTCNVTLSTKDDGVFYSKELNATMEGPREPQDEKDEKGTSHGLVIGLSILAAFVIIIGVGLVVRFTIH